VNAAFGRLQDAGILQEVTGRGDRLAVEALQSGAQHRSVDLAQSIPQQVPIEEEVVDREEGRGR
jgi:hypothetical protein